MKKLIISLLFGAMALTSGAEERAYQAEEINAYQVGEISVINYGDGRLLFRKNDDENTPLQGLHRIIDGYRSEYVLAEFQDGMYNGKYQHFKNDFLIEVANFTNGRLEGDRKQYYGDGKTLRSEASFVEGKLNGTIRNYRQDGSVESEKEYKMGIEDGFDRRYHHETGKLTIDTYYKEGKPEGRWVEHLEGNVGNVTRISNYKNGLRDGEWSETSADGKPRGKSSYKEGKKDGVWITYRKDGSQEKKTTYKNDLKNGEEIIYFTDGTVDKSINYVNDKRNGVTKEYYFTSGKTTPKSEYTYKEGKQNGEYKCFDQDGKLKEEGRCENGTEVYRKLYHSNGKLRSIAEKRGGGWETLESYDSNGNKE